MNNIILLIIDSMNNTRIKDSSIELTPFLNSLKKKGVYCESVYSQAPYTEAANMSIYCGNNVLDAGGYLYRYRQASLTIFEAMKQCGYRTYFNALQPQCYPSSLRRGIDDIFYNVGFDLEALWSYRLSHYAELLKKGQLTETDYNTLEEIMEDNFGEWIIFAENVKKQDLSTEMIRNNAKSYDVDEVLSAVQEQFKRFRDDRKSYIVDILCKGKKHEIFQIPSFKQNQKIKDRGVINWVEKEYRPLLKKIKRMDFKLNLKNCKGLNKGIRKQFKKFISKPNKVTLKDFLKSGYLVWNQLFDSDLYERIQNDYDSFKNAPSLRTHIEHYIDWATKNKSKEPHFACIHADDVHNPEVFFTYDTSDKTLLQKELEEANELLDRIPKDYSGSLSHDLSLRYIDGIVKYLFDELKRTGMENNTNVLICADHGFSFGGNPLRDSFVINLYLENYNIPFVVTGPEIKPRLVQGLHASKDIPATICGLAGRNVPKEFNGIDVLHSEETYPILYIEYCGGGCPDLTRRELKLAAYDDKYFVGTLIKLDEEISNSSLTEIYDLRNDPKQLVNLVREWEEFEKIGYLIDALRTRKEQIKQELIRSNNKK